MPRPQSLSSELLARLLREAGPGGLGPEALEKRLPGISRSTLGRRLKSLAEAGSIKVLGRGPAVRYVAGSGHSIEDVRRYFATDWQQRPLVGFREELLQPAPGLEADQAARLGQVHARARPLDRKFLADFLIDFSWASSVLEGSTYSSIDTQALIQYGERNPDKPTEDAILILDHKNAIQHLWADRSLSVDNVCALHAFLTDGHGLAEVADSDHFLPDTARGVLREYSDVHLGRSAYSPPFRPASGYIARAFGEILATAATLSPVQAAFYLMSRIPYLQAFSNGNKRTARLAANLPLLKAGLLPISFVDFRKADYILGMSAFYELGDTQLLQQVFVEGYARSIVRGSDIPAALRLSGPAGEDLVQSLLAYVRSGRKSQAGLEIFLGQQG